MSPQQLLSVSEKMLRLLKGAMRIMTFSEFKSQDSILLNNCTFVYDFLQGNLPDSFQNTFTRTDDLHATNTRQASSGMLTTPHFNTTTFGLKSICSKCIKSWNTISFEINKIDREKNINNPNITDHNRHRSYKNVA